MKNLFSTDNGLFRAMSRLADLMILNLTFLVCCLPIFTIGASTTALYYVTLKMAENEEGYIFRSFLKSFRANFRQATIIWMSLLIFGCLLATEFYITLSMEGTMKTVCQWMIAVVVLILVMVLLYVFPLLARFDNTVFATLRNSLFFSIAYFPRTLLMIVVLIAAVLLTIWNFYTVMWGILIWLLLGFSTLAFINSQILKKVIAKYM